MSALREALLELRARLEGFNQHGDPGEFGLEQMAEAEAELESLRTVAAPATQEAPSAPAEPLEVDQLLTHAMRLLYTGDYEARTVVARLGACRAALSVSTSAPKETSEPRRWTPEVLRELGEWLDDWNASPGIYPVIGGAKYAAGYLVRLIAKDLESHSTKARS